MSQMEQKPDGLVTLLAQPENARTSSVVPGQCSTSQSPSSTGQSCQSPTTSSSELSRCRAPRGNGCHVESFPGGSPIPRYLKDAMKRMGIRIPQSMVGRESGYPSHTVAAYDWVLNLGFAANLVDGVMHSKAHELVRGLDDDIPE